MKGAVRTRQIALAVVVLAGWSPALAQQPVRLAIADGRVTMHVQNAAPRAILAEWARVGGATVVDGDRVTGAPLTLDLEGVPERQALGIVLRGVSGYILGAREPGRGGSSMFDRIVILPTSTAPRAPVGPPIQPAGVARAPVAPPEIQNLEPNAEPGDGAGLARPSPGPRQLVAPSGLPAPPPTLDTPEDAPAAPPQPAVVVGTPANPFGVPPGSSSRPGVIGTPPPAQPREAPAN